MSKAPQSWPGMQPMPEVKKPTTPSQMDLMRPGNGTPWEDRGTAGPVAAYFKTAIASMKSPGLLMDHINRPESTDDARVFSIVSAVMWGLGVFGCNVYWVYMVLPKSADYERDISVQFWVTAILQAGLVGYGAFLWTKIGANMFKAMAGDELKRVAPSLIYNCYAYSMGPSLVALVPVIGWPIAFVWIVFNQFVTAKRRFYMNMVSSVVNTLIIAVCAAGAAAALYFFLGLLWCSYWGMNGLTRIEHKPATSLIHQPSHP